MWHAPSEVLALSYDVGAAPCLGVPMAETIAVGDSANDLPMIRTAGLGLAVANVNPTIAAQVPHILRGSCADAAMMEVYERFVAPSVHSMP